MSLIPDLQYAMELVRKAGQLVIDAYGRVERLTKRHAEAVTEADRASQRLIVAGLRGRFPQDGIVGEENETGDAITFECPNPNGRVWVIDPIDGTNNFVAGLDNFAIAVGLLDAGFPVLGIVFDVTRNRIYHAAKGHGAFLDARRITACQTPLSQQSVLMLTSNLMDNSGRLPGFGLRWHSQTQWKVRILGSAALDAMQVAAGGAHGAVTTNGKLWDIAGPAAILLEAGANVTGLNGVPVFPFDLQHYNGRRVPFLAAAPQAHGTLLQEIQAHP
jgi:myo-inositol-1(or 4)-monophosphatase